MNHHPTLDTATYTCPACPWRAVLTTDGRIVQTTPGDAGHDHIGQARAEQAQRIAFAAQTIARVKRQYTERAALPRCDGLHIYPCEEAKTGRCVCAHQDRYTLTLNQLQHLYRAIIGEHR